MDSHWIRSLAEQLVKSGFAAPETLKGCSEEEIAQLELQAGVHLPKAYKDFLLAFGKESGTFLEDCCYLYPTLLTYCRSQAEELAQKQEITLSPSWFVFLERNIMCLYFDTADGDDPPVWRISEDKDHPEKLFDSFSSCLKSLVDTDTQTT